jgi:hypothetical protein
MNSACSPIPRAQLGQRREPRILEQAKDRRERRLHGVRQVADRRPRLLEPAPDEVEQAVDLVDERLDLARRGRRDRLFASARDLQHVLADLLERPQRVADLAVLQQQCRDRERRADAEEHEAEAAQLFADLREVLADCEVDMRRADGHGAIENQERLVPRAVDVRDRFRRGRRRGERSGPRERRRTEALGAGIDDEIVAGVRTAVDDAGALGIEDQPVRRVDVERRDERVAVVLQPRRHLALSDVDDHPVGDDPLQQQASEQHEQHAPEPLTQRVHPTAVALRGSACALGSVRPAHCAPSNT